ncbi:hypothetical protein COP1_032751 [Malus domestica]
MLPWKTWCFLELVRPEHASGERESGANTKRLEEVVKKSKRIGGGSIRSCGSLCGCLKPLETRRQVLGN